MSGRVVVIGSLNLDLVTHVERHPKPGETLLGDALSKRPRPVRAANPVTR